MALMSDDSSSKNFWFYMFMLAALITVLAVGTQWLREMGSYRRIIFESFGAEETQRRIAELYRLIDTNEIKNELTKPEDGMSWMYSHSNVRLISPSRIAHVFDHDDSLRNLHQRFAGLAYFDEEGKLEGLHFAASRFGCFASKDPTLCPAYFTKLYRMNTGELFLTGIDSSGGS